MRAVVGSLDVDPAHTVDSFALLVLVQMVRASRSAPCRLQKSVVGPAAVLTLVQQDVQRLLVYPCLGELHLWYSGATDTDYNSVGNTQKHQLTTRRLDSILISNKALTGLNTGRVSFPAPYLGLLLLRGVDDGGAAHLGDLPALAVKRPAADLVSDHVFNEEHAAVKAQRELIEQLDVLQHVVVRVTGDSEMAVNNIGVYTPEP